MKKSEFHELLRNLNANNTPYRLVTKEKYLDSVAKTKGAVKVIIFKENNEYSGYYYNELNELVYHKEKL
jgi:hypothetical protein